MHKLLRWGKPNSRFAQQQLDYCKVHSFFYPPEETNSLFSRTPYSSQDIAHRDNEHSFSSAQKNQISDSEETILLARSESPCGTNAAQNRFQAAQSTFFCGDLLRPQAETAHLHGEALIQLSS
jgi:hypothetical protein